MRFKGIICAVNAGFFAASASVCAKIATSSDASIYVSKLLAKAVENVFDLHLNLADTMNQVSLVFRIGGVAGMFLCNALMWILFTKSMHLCFSVLEATAFNTASNFFFTAFLGFFLFGEKIGLQWYFGSTLMVIGLVILHKSCPQENELGQEKEKHPSIAQKSHGNDVVREEKKTL